MLLAILLMLFGTVATILSVVAVFRVTGRHRPAVDPTTLPPVSVLKPLCGADDQLAANLATFFQLDYPDYELVFGVEDEADPAIAVVRELRDRFPGTRVRLMVHDGKRALNPKVSNLTAMLEAGAHDVVVISDSNVAVRPDYLSAMAAELDRDATVGLVTHIFYGTGEKTLGATLENLHLAGPVAGSVAITDVFGKDAVSVGKSMMFRRSVFQRLGGWSAVGTYLAEDYVMGRMFASAGYRVTLGHQAIANVCTHTTVRRFLHRHLRWGLIRSRVKPFVYPLEWLFSPMAIALVAPLLGFFGPIPLIWGVAMTLIRDAAQWTRLRGAAGLAHALPLGPIKELMLLGVWAVAPFIRHVSWRGNKYRVSSGTRLYADHPIPAPMKLRCE